ncbi:1,4-dihydroxy-2-naphthoate octaprenyltransferase [Blattabacterium cuenoti]|uniref:1,4-dihydroxy-2-naphthoate octaprenyltransferase n=1 Tax=Blattabacterium cuenoti TaxID=1653831 RepID=UPI00163C8579|nr:1,4-dihydroxy-2-naphthoate octaprenyltransferase [Blattabacterium cuenoti]
MNINHWIYAIRIHTLPLSISGVTSSYFLSINKYNINIYHCTVTYILCVFTCLSLQVLSNLSNDYGDSILERYLKEDLNQKKAVQRGLISLMKMKRAIYLFSILSFCFGLILIYRNFFPKEKIIFFIYLVGLFSCIYSSIGYSIGEQSYGRMGLGDLFVLVFFGFFSVLGSFFLYTNIFPKIDMFILSLSIGLLNVAVLNLNNMRDIDMDYKNGKKTIPVFIGIKYAKLYHVGILLVSNLLGLIFLYFNNKNIYEWIFILCIFLFFIFHMKNILFIEEKNILISELKKLIFISFLYSVGLTTSICL